MNKIVIKADAYGKMRTLVKEFTGEVGALGLCYRKQEDGDWIFTITDIYLYPQYVAGARVVTDDAEYSEFINNLDDEIFNNTRFQMHSHVMMSTFASGTDLADQRNTRSQLGPDDFYIHLITNKRDENHWFVYNQGEVDEHPEVEVETDLDWDLVKGLKELPNVDYSDYILEEKRTSGLLEEDGDELDDFLDRYRKEKEEEFEDEEYSDWWSRIFKRFR